MNCSCNMQSRAQHSCLAMFALSAICRAMHHSACTSTLIYCCCQSAAAADDYCSNWKT
jgi:hypothetical protein